MFRFIAIYFLGLLTKKNLYKKGQLAIHNKEILKKLPDTNVLFLSTHTTYYMEAAAMLHSFWYAKTDFEKDKYIMRKKPPVSHFNMVVEYKSFKKEKDSLWLSIITKLMNVVGTILVKREHTNTDVSDTSRKKFNIEAFKKMEKALNEGALIFFPQGTTKSKARIQSGTFKIIRENNPIIVPVVTKNFDIRYGKKGIFVNDHKETLNVTFKEPFQFPKDSTNEEMRVSLVKLLELED
jgi:1-acyl-sn-glycerol-3-phosphate acyltransferase